MHCMEQIQRQIQRDLQVGTLKLGQGRVQDKNNPVIQGGSDAFYTKEAIFYSYMLLKQFKVCFTEQYNFFNSLELKNSYDDQGNQFLRVCWRREI